MEENKLTFDEYPESKNYAMLKPMNIKNTSFFYLPNKINKIGRSAECDIIFSIQAFLKYMLYLSFAIMEILYLEI